MADQFKETLVRDIYIKNVEDSGNLIKSSEIEIKGLVKVTIEEDEVDGIKIFLKRDSNDAVKEIKFVCSCGLTKSIILDYSD